VLAHVRMRRQGAVADGSADEEAAACSNFDVGAQPGDV